MLRFLFPILALAVLPAQSWAQRVELTPFVGYRFGGGFTDVTTSGSTTQRDIEIDEGLSLGIVLDISLSRLFQLELLFDRQASHLNRVDSDGDETPLTDGKVNYYHVGLLFQGKSTIQPFAAITTGATHFRTPEDTDDEWRSSLGIALGGKTRFNEWIGARLQARLVATYIGSDDELLCGTPDGCYTKLNETIMRQLDLSGGVIFHF